MCALRKFCQKTNLRFDCSASDHTVQNDPEYYDAVDDNCVIREVNETKISTPSHRSSRSLNFHKPSSSILSKPRIVNLRPSESISRTEPLCATATFFFWVAILSAPVASSNGKERSPWAYEVLQSHGFPVGLLPKGITGYELDEATASLNGNSNFTLESSYELKYKRRIEGVIKREMLRKLKGVSVKVTVVTLSIVEVARQGGKLEFSVGVASAGFPVENFAECPQCGCGLTCNATVSEFGASSSSSLSSS